MIRHHPCLGSTQISSCLTLQCEVQNRVLLFRTRYLLHQGHLALHHPHGPHHHNHRLHSIHHRHCCDHNSHQQQPREPLCHPSGLTMTFLGHPQPMQGHRQH